MDIVTYALLNGKIKDYASNVDEWLEENVDPTTGYVLDRSLQMENAAAPADMVGDINDDVGELRNTLNHKADVIYDTASGDIASFPDGADGLPVKDLTVGIEPVQDLHGYENPWPAGGGKNLIGGGSGGTISGVTFTINADGSISTSGTATDGVELEINDANARTLKFASGEKFILTGCPSGGSSSTYRLRVGKFYNGTRYGTYTYDSGSGATFDPSASAPAEVLSSGECDMTARLIVYNGTNMSGLTFKPMLRKSTETDATFAPYSNICPISGWTGCNISHSGVDTSGPTVIPISWQSSAGTVYGGTLDVTSGVLTVDRVGVDLGTLSWYYNSGNVLFETTISDIRSGYTYNSDLSDIICSMFTAKSQGSGWGGMENGSFGVSGTSFRAKNTSYTSPSDFTTSVNGQTLIYPLATPQTYQLTPQEVTTLLGQNNIWADCGPSTVEYPADTKLYIDKKLAALVAALS